MLEWVAISFLEDLPNLGIEAVSRIGNPNCWILYHFATKEAPYKHMHV